MSVGDLVLELLLGGRGLGQGGLGGRLVALDGGVRPLLRGERRGGPLLELLERGLAVVELAQALVEGSLLGRRRLAQVVRLGARVLGRLVERGERGLVLRDLVGERLVLLADVDVVAHLGEHVGERAARQEGLEERRPIGVVGAPQALGEELLADRQVGLLGDLLGLDDGQVGIERLELDDEVVVVAPDHVDLGFHRGDLHLDRGEIGVDALEDAGGVLDLRGELALEGRQLGDHLRLGGHVLLDLRPGAPWHRTAHRPGRPLGRRARRVRRTAPPRGGG